MSFSKVKIISAIIWAIIILGCTAIQTYLGQSEYVYYLLTWGAVSHILLLNRMKGEVG